MHRNSKATVHVRSASEPATQLAPHPLAHIGSSCAVCQGNAVSAGAFLVLPSDSIAAFRTAAAALLLLPAHRPLP